MDLGERVRRRGASLLGRGVEVEMVIRAMEAGTMRRLKPAGILSPRVDDLGLHLRQRMPEFAIVDLDDSVLVQGEAPIMLMTIEFGGISSLP